MQGYNQASNGRIYTLRETTRIGTCYAISPSTNKGIREKAISEVFAKEIDNLDPNARKIVDDVIDYMEKKYISVPMKMAKEILLKEAIK